MGLTLEIVYRKYLVTCSGLEQMSQTDNKKDITSRPAPILRHVSVGPPGAATDFLKEQLNKQERSNFNSSSLDTPAIIGEKGEKNQNMTQKNVNKTALHPGGVQ